MNRHLLDVRVWGPMLVGIACFVPRALPPAAARPGMHPAAVELPQPRGLPPATAAVHCELVGEQSSVRFHVTGPRGEMLATCSSISGDLRLDGKQGTGSLDLRLDLTSLTDDAPLDGLDVHHVLGAMRTSSIAYHADLVATTRCDLPGVQRLLFLGRLHLGERTLLQPMELWQCSLPGQPMRTQGHGTVQAAVFGLPERRRFGIWPERHEVTLGLDLAWRRTREH